MTNRERTRSAPSSSSGATEEQPTPYEVGKTTLDLDDISDEELEALYFEDDDAEEGLLNLPTITGLTLIVGGVVYLLSEMGVWSGAVLSSLSAALPLLGGILVILLGFGLLTWRSSEPSDASEQKKAVDAETGETKVVEDPAPSNESRLTRSRTDKKLMGVCGGLADYLNLDSTFVRIAFVVGVVVSGGPFILAYFLLAVAMPKEEPLSPEERISIIRNDRKTDG